MFGIVLESSFDGLAECLLAEHCYDLAGYR